MTPANVTEYHVRGLSPRGGFLGLDRSTQYARQLVAEASEALAGFGSDADGLRSVARFVLERNH